jgi:hypothetical protein
MIIRVTHSDLGTVARGRGGIYITGTTPERQWARVWMGPESCKSLRDAVRRDGAVWCDVPLDQICAGTWGLCHAGWPGPTASAACQGGFRGPRRGGAPV